MNTFLALALFIPCFAIAQIAFRASDDGHKKVGVVGFCVAVGMFLASIALLLSEAT